MKRKVRVAWVEFIGGPHDGESMSLRVDAESGPPYEYRFVKRKPIAALWRSTSMLPLHMPPLDVQLYRLNEDGKHYHYVGEGNA